MSWALRARQQAQLRKQAERLLESDDAFLLAQCMEALAKRTTLPQTQAIVSLDAPMSRDQADPLMLVEMLADPKATEMLEQVEQEPAPADALSQMLAQLSAQERQVLILHLGLQGEAPLPLREVGTLVGLSGEGVRQVEQRALDKLRGSSQVRALWQRLHEYSI